MRGWSISQCCYLHEGKTIFCFTPQNEAGKVLLESLGFVLTNGQLILSNEDGIILSRRFNAFEFSKGGTHENR